MQQEAWGPPTSGIRVPREAGEPQLLTCTRVWIISFAQSLAVSGVNQRKNNEVQGAVLVQADLVPGPSAPAQRVEVSIQ